MDGQSFTGSALVDSREFLAPAKVFKGEKKEKKVQKYKDDQKSSGEDLFVSPLYYMLPGNEYLHPETPNLMSEFI